MTGLCYQQSVRHLRNIRGYFVTFQRSLTDSNVTEISPKPPRRRTKLTEIKPEYIEKVVDCLAENKSHKDGLIILDNIATAPLLSAVQGKSSSNIACLFGDSRKHEEVDAFISEEVKAYQYSWINSTNKSKEMKILKQALLKSLPDGHVTLVSVLQTNQAGRENLLIKRFITSQGFFSAANLQLLCFVSAKFYTKLVRCTYPPPFKTFNAFYDHKLCLKLSANNFKPKMPTPKIGKFSLLPGLSSTDICLVLIRPRKHVLSEMSQQDRLMFSLFMKMLTNDRLIHKMESLVPGCGLRLIELGFSMSDETANVHPHRYLTLYKELSTLAEFEGSMLSVLLKDKQGQFKNTSTLFEL